MSTKKVTVSSPVVFFDEYMDSTAVPQYVEDAKTRGYFLSPEGDIYIPWNETAGVVIHEADRESAGREDIGNF